MGRSKKKKYPEEILTPPQSLSPRLSFEELQQIYSNTCKAADIHGRIGFNHYSIEWHPDYPLQGWKDGAGPLILTDAYQMPDFFFIGYVCSGENCSRCDTAFPVGHHKLLDQTGRDLYDKTPVFKKATIG
jgi:hypothetical protein